MKRMNVLSGFVAGVMLFGIASFSAFAQGGDVVEVSPDENWLSAIAAAAPDTTIQLEAGTYTVSSNDAFRIEQDGITIAGQGKQTTIDLNGFSCSGQAGILVSGDDVTLKDFQLTDSTGTDSNVAGIKFTNLDATGGETRTKVSNPKVENVVVKNVKGHGINMHHVESGVITGVTVTGAGKCGVSIADATVRIDGSDLTDNKWGSVGLMWGSDPVEYPAPSTVTLGAGNSLDLVYQDQPDWGYVKSETDALYFNKINGQGIYTTVAGETAYKVQVGNVQYDNLASAFANAGSSDTVTLLDNIDLSGTEWTPVETFSGTFDGNGKVITGLTITGSQEESRGLFRHLSGATVKKLTISGATFSTLANVETGILAARADNTTITDCNISGIIRAEGNGAYESGNVGVAAAGFVEYAYQSTIRGCVSDVDITASSTKEIMYAGGIACEVNGGVIDNCSNTGDIFATSPKAETGNAYTYAGGIAAYVKNGATVTNCTNSGNIRAGDEVCSYGVGGGILGQIWAESAGTITLTGSDNSGVITAREGTTTGYDDAYNWSCVGDIVGEVYAYGAQGQLTNTLILDAAAEAGIGWDQRDEAVAELQKTDGTVWGYATLEDAIADAENGDTVKLLQDVILTGSGDKTKGQVLDIQQGITLDGNGKRVTASGFAVDSTGKATCDIFGVTGVRYGYPVHIKNLTIVGDGLTTKYGINVFKSTNVTLENVTIQNCTARGLLVNASEVTAIGTLEFSDHGWGNTINVGWGSSATMDRCSFDAGKATLIGVAGIYVGDDDVANSNGTLEEKFSITPPAGWIKSEQAGAALLYIPAAASVDGTGYSTVEEAVEAVKDTTEPVEIVLAESNTAANITAAVGAVANAANENISLTVPVADGSASFSTAAITSIKEAAGDSGISLKIVNTTEAAVTNVHTYEITLTAGGVPIANDIFEEHPVTLTLPVGDLLNPAVYCVLAEGDRENMQAVVQNGFATFTTARLSASYELEGSVVAFTDSEIAKSENGAETKYGVRFIFEYLGGKDITGFGAYLLPLSIFEKNPADFSDAAKVMYDGGTLSAGQTFSADLIDIPNPTTVIAVPILNNTANVDAYASADVTEGGAQ